MSPPFRKFILVLSIWVITALACNIFTPEYEAKIKQEATQTTIAKMTAQVTTEVLEPAHQEMVAQLNADEKLIFNYAGENQSLHTGLRNRTVFYIDYDGGTVTAIQEASFEEPFGIQTSRGKDFIQFNGIYDDAGKWFSGDLIINTQATATGGESGPTIITYAMTGILTANLVDNQWLGTVTGSATMTQTWPESPTPDSVTPTTIAWTITGTPVE
jgi:hypothetical protein